MKILFDTNTPAALAHFLKGHTVIRAAQKGWARLTNGVLLDVAENAGFDVLLTCDQSIQYQQNFTDRNIAVVILSSNHWPSMRPLAAKIATAVDFVQRSSIIRLDLRKL